MKNYKFDQCVLTNAYNGIAPTNNWFIPLLRSQLGHFNKLRAIIFDVVSQTFRKEFDHKNY